MTTEKQKVLSDSVGVERSTHLVVESDSEILDVLGPSVQFLVALQANDAAPCVIKGTILPGVSVPIHRHGAIDPGYRYKAQWFQKILKQSRGLDGLRTLVERGGNAKARLPQKRESGIPHASCHYPLVGGGYFPVVSRIAAWEATSESVP
jgi:hypothetical protein